MDPWRPVDHALITHAHSDHARDGHAAYLAAAPSAPALRHRLGNIRIDTLPFGERISLNGVTISFHPAGHVPGSAQIRIERRGEVWVVSGDYKTTVDRLSEPWEPVRCHTFISESTFGLPIFRWAPEAEVAAAINMWWAQALDDGHTPMLGAYTLGKAQRILTLLDPSIGPILTHGAVEAMTGVLREQGLALPKTIQVTPEIEARTLQGGIVIAPPSALSSPWARRFGTLTTAFASGWMAVRGIRRRRGADRGFVLSDHADWQGLNEAIRATGATRVLVTHGYTAAFTRWLSELGYDAGVLETEYGGESLDAIDGAEHSA